MSYQVIRTSAAPAALGPYSQAIVAGGFLFASGQIPLDPKTQKLVEGNVVVQTRQALSNIQGVLAAKGLGFANVVKTTVFLKDMNDFAAMNAVYAKAFPQNAPARSTVEVARLPKDVLVEIEIIAAL